MLHADLPFTERMDYFFAAMTIMFALYLAAVRIFHLYPDTLKARLILLPRASRECTTGFKLWSWTCTLVYIGHVSYLSLLPRFDYHYNIVFNLCLGMLHNLIWLSYSLPSQISLLRRFRSRPKSYRPVFAYKPAFLVASTTAALGLELFDFPPWRRTIDAHSLWHLATAPIAFYWYEFVIEDALDDGWRDKL